VHARLVEDVEFPVGHGPGGGMIKRCDSGPPARQSPVRASPCRARRTCPRSYNLGLIYLKGLKEV